MNAFTTIAGFQGGTVVGQIASQTLASTTETEFQINQIASPASSGIAILTIPQTGDILGSQSRYGVDDNQANFARRNQPFPPTTLSFDKGRPFLIRVAGLATPASNAGNSLNIILYNGTTKGGTAIASTAAVPQATTTIAKSFILEAECIWDSTSQTLDGQFWFAMKGTSGTRYATWAQLSNPGSGITAAKLQFVASATWANAAGGVVAVSEMSVSQL